MTATTAAIDAFVTLHDPCGELTGTSSPATADGFHVFLTCICGAELDRHVTLDEATEDLSRLINGD